MSQSVVSIVRNLQRRNARRRVPLVVLEGVRLVEEALAASVRITAAAVSPSLERTERGRRLARALHDSVGTVDDVPDDVLADIADTEAPQGVLAVAEPRRWAPEDVAASSDSVFVVLDGVRDPGNVGAILRAALGLGAGAAFLVSGTARLTHPKVLRAAMGATFRLPSVPVPGAAFLAWAASNGVALWAADPRGTPVTGLTPRGPTAILIGSEGAGLSRELADAADRRVAVGLTAGVESLNAAVAAGIILHEVLRDR